jgi:ribosomal protein L11 methyltransferase
MQHTAPMSYTQWWNIFIQVPAGLSEVTSVVLHDLGSTAVVLHEQAALCPSRPSGVVTTADTADWCVLQGALPAADDFPTRIATLQTFLHRHATAQVPLRLYCQPLQDDAYLTQWQRFFQPIQIEQRLVIRPPWDTTPVPAAMACLTLEPGLAFGTGSHPTTYLALTLLAQYSPLRPNSQLLDVGCGSGILSLAALALGVHKAIGVDIEAQAITVATANAALNRLQHRVHFRQGSWEVTADVFDVITANIYLGPLVNMMHPLAQRLAPHGILILSGILTFQEAPLRTALATARLTVVKRLVKDNWVALAAQHDNKAQRHAPSL